MINPTISVMGEEEPIEIGFDALAAYHGQSALAMLAITFQCLRATTAILSPQSPAPRSAFFIVSGHPGPGVRDAFEFVTRAVTRGAYVIDLTLPDARHNPFAEISYSFTISLGKRTAHAALKKNVLPDRFFELIALKSKSDVIQSEFSALKRAIAADVLAVAPATLFDIA
jgi:hypothetical protein